MKSPFTGEYTLYKQYYPEDGIMFCMCTETGFFTYEDKLHPESDLVREVESGLVPDTIEFKRVVDNHVWYPFQDYTDTIAIFPMKRDGMLKWMVAEMVSAPNKTVPVLARSISEYKMIAPDLKNGKIFDTFKDAYNFYLSEIEDGKV